MKNIEVILRETIENFINEELSINAEIVDVTNDIVSNVLTKYAKNEKKYEAVNIVIDGIIYAVRRSYLATNINLLKENTLNVNVIIYDVFNEETFDKVWERLNLGGLSHGHSINVNAYSINGKLNISFLKQVISHELEHFYQFFKSEKELATITYKKASDIVLNKDIIHTNEMYKAVANIIYFLNKNEIDANIQGLFNELIANKDYAKSISANELLKHSTLYNEYENIHKANVKKFMDNVNNENTQKILNYFGFNINSFIKYIRSNEAYLNSKIRKAIQMTYNKINENIIPTLKIKPKDKRDYID